MPLQMPKPTADYFAADKQGSPELLAQCFTKTAIVLDEGKSYVGHDAIRKWKAEASIKYTYTVDPLSIAHEEKFTVVIGRVEGDFPGSPINLKYRFVIEGDKISALEILP